MKRWMVALMLISVVMLTGCQWLEEEVPQGYVGRNKTPSGWDEKIESPGYVTSWYRDILHLVEATQGVYHERMNILVGGKINLDITVSVRCRLDSNDEDKVREAFEKITAVKAPDGETATITNKQLFDTYLKLNVQAIPRKIIGSQPDVQSVVANRTEIADQIKKQVVEVAAATPLEVTDVEITNYDWPDSITRAQENLMTIKLEEEKQEAQVRADLKRAEGDLKVAEAKKLVKMKDAEALAESTKILQDSLADAPEYLRYHEIMMLSEAANGPNNAFIVIPYGDQGSAIQDKILLTQMIEKAIKDKK